MEPKNKGQGAHQESHRAVGFIKGVSLGHMRAYAVMRFGPTEWDRFVASLPKPCRRIVVSLDEAAWYPAHHHAVINRAFVEFYAHGDMTVAEELGKASVGRDFASSYRWYFALTSLSYALEHLGAYWHRAHDTGRWEAELHDGNAVARLRDWVVAEKAFCHRIKGYFGHALELAGYKVTVRHPVCRASGGSYCEFRLQFQTTGTPAPNDAKLTRTEIASIGSTLRDIAERTALVDAILKLLRVYLACPRAELRLVRREDGELMRVASYGEEQEFTSVHALTTANGSIGQIIIGAPLSWPC